MRVVGLISSFDEPTLIEGAVRSASVLDQVIVFEGPVGDAEYGPEAMPAYAAIDRRVLERALLHNDRWLSDAAKRTAMVEYAMGRHLQTRAANTPLWGVWVDADELLLWGEYLRPYLERIGAEDVSGRGEGFKFPLRLVELDGNVALCHGKVVRLDLIERYHRSSSDVEFKGSPIVRVLGNEPNWRPAQLGADGEIVEQQWAQTPLQRPPLQGEPHLLHRSALRPPRRAGLRLHEAEAAAWEGMKAAAGLEDVG